MQNQQSQIVAEAEMSVIGGLLLDYHQTREAALELAPEEFYYDKTREIFQIIMEKGKKREPVDFITVLAAMGETPDAKVLLVKCAETLPTLGNFTAYVNIVKNEAQKRRISTVLQDLTFGTGFSSAEMLAKLKGLLDTEQAQDTSYREDQMLYDLGEYRALLYDTSRDHKISTGYGNLDYLLGELEKQNVTIVGARPGMGKTAFACNLSTNIQKRGRKVLFFSLEMPKFQLFHRLAANLVAIEHNRIRDNKTTAEEKAKIITALLALAENNNYYVFDDVYSIERMESIIARSRPDVVIIDYIQLVLANHNFQRDMDRISHVSRESKRIAKTYKCQMIELAQLSREVDKRPVKTPVLADLRECGQLEQDADTVIFIYREYAYNKAVPPEPTSIIVAKNRHGETGLVDYRFEGAYQRFLEVDRYSTPPDDGWMDVDIQGPWPPAEDEAPEQQHL